MARPRLHLVDTNVLLRLAAILAFPGVKARGKGLLMKALARFGSSAADFVDCLLAARAAQDDRTIYSFDARDFRRLGVSWQPPT